MTCFPDATGYMVGSIEGRVAVQHVEDSAQSKNFTFKCHRQDADIYAVNAVTFHPVHGTFVTAGSDGSYNFWDKVPTPPPPHPPPAHPPKGDKSVYRGPHSACTQANMR